MNRIIIYDYSPELTAKLAGEDLIPRVGNFDIVDVAYKDASQFSKVFCIWVDTPYMSLSDMSFGLVQSTTPIVVHAYNLGDVYKVLSEVDDLRRLNIRIFLSSTCEDNFGAIKLLSSLGVDCGILIDSDSVDDDLFLDLASYSLLGQVPHASIEPFDYIWRNVRSDRNLDFDTTYFKNPLKYIYADNELNYSFSYEDLTNHSYVGNLNNDSVVSFDAETKIKLKEYYSHFIELNKCSKCASFKVCNRRSSTLFKNCSDVFSTIYEYTELRDQNERQNFQKNICQL